MKRIALIAAATLFFTRFVAAAPLDLDWKDAARDRAVPVRVYLPAKSEAAPVVIFSHGLGGSREGYSFLGTYWSEHGYVAVHMQHVGSDESVWKGAGGAAAARTKLMAAANFDELTQRVADVHFTIDELTKLNTDEKSPLHGRLDLTRIAMAGHSFGGHTTQAIMGQQFPGTGAKDWPDERVRCAIDLSPSPPEMRSRGGEAFAKISMPVLYVTGTKDDSPIGDIKAADRRLPFDASPAGDKYLLTFADADHMVFAGAPRLRGKARDIDKVDQPLVQKATTAFLDAYLKSDTAGKTYLKDGLSRQAGAAVKMETK